MESWIELRAAEGRTLRAYLARPPRGRGPGVVLCQEIFGVNADMRRMADLLAQEGYVVAVPDLFWRQQPGVELGYEAADRARAMELLAGLDQAQALDDIGLAAQALRDPALGDGGVGVMGFCLGGRLAALAAASGHFDCAVSYYGVGLEKVLDQLGNVTVPMVLHFGAADAAVPPSARAQVAQALGGREQVRIHVYAGAAHAFANPARTSYDRTAAGIAWSRSIAVLRRVLGPSYDLEALWEAHRACEFETRDAAATMRTMVAEPYVNHVPTMTGGVGQQDLHRFYAQHFIPQNPKDMQSTLVSRTVGADRVVNETVLRFTHDCVIDWLLPGIAPTGRRVEVALVGIITFRGDKLVHEHIYWDQASVLAQIGLLDAERLPVTGAAAAAKVLDPRLPSNALLERGVPR